MSTFRLSDRYANYKIYLEQEHKKAIRKEIIKFMVYAGFHGRDRVIEVGDVEYRSMSADFLSDGGLIKYSLDISLENSVLALLVYDELDNVSVYKVVTLPDSSFESLDKFIDFMNSVLQEFNLN